MTEITILFHQRHLYFGEKIRVDPHFLILHLQLFASLFPAILIIATLLIFGTQLWLIRYIWDTLTVDDDLQG